MSINKSSKDNPGSTKDISVVPEKTGRNVLDVGFNEVIEEQKTRERIQKMADIHSLSGPELEERKLIHPGMRDTNTLNIFRELRTKIYQHAGENDNFILMITSLTPGGGSSFVSLNIGATIALDKSKTAIIVDCNLYHPGVHNILPLEPDYGLSDYLDNISLDAEDIIYSSGVRRLRVVPAGKNQEPGTEYFTSNRMKRFLSEVKSRYKDRHVVVDAPPLETSADARILSELCDYVLLVVPYGKVTSGQIKAGVDSIDPKKLIGVVFNA